MLLWAATLRPWVRRFSQLTGSVLSVSEVAVLMFSLPRIYEVSVETACTKSSLTPSRALVTTKFPQKSTGRRAPKKKKRSSFTFNSLPPIHSLAAGLLLFPSFSFLVDSIAG